MRGEVSIAPLLYNIVYIKKRDGAPVDIIFPPDGVPLNYYAAGVTKAVGQSERRKAVPELVHVRGRPGLPRSRSTAT